ncbi:MAG: hypothetical protein KDK40_03840, partial [Chlamydiia bacterium]|nr:hypothetical protein [Chlamydiia bacterium]
LPLVYFEDRQRQPTNKEEENQREEEIRSTQEEVQSLCFSQSLFTGAMYFAENVATFLNSGLNCTVLSNLIKLNG